MTEVKTYKHRLSGIIGKLVTGNVRQRDHRVLMETTQGERLWVAPEYLEEQPQ